MYAKDQYEAKYQYLVNKREGVGIGHFNDPKAFIEYSNDMHHVYINIDEYNPDKENKILIAFDDMIAHMIHNKKLDSIVTELFIRGRKLNISLVFITQSILRFQKMLDCILLTFLSQKFQTEENLEKLRQIIHQILALKISLISRKCTVELYSFLVNDTTLASDNPLRFRKLF